MSWTANYSITIDHTKVPNTDLSDFPMLFAGVFPALATTANGGQVTSASGFDIILAADSAGATPLAFQRVFWNAITGYAQFRVKVPALSHTTDTVIYILVGNSAITTEQQNVTGTWSNSYAGAAQVNGTTAIQVFDPIAGTNWSENGTPTLVLPGYTKPFVGAASMPNNANYPFKTPTGWPSGTAQRTVECWFKLSTTTQTNQVLVSYGNNSSTQAFTISYGWSSPNASIFIDIFNGSITWSWASQDTNWHHLAIVVPSGQTSLSSSFLAYVDGVALTFSSTSGTLTFNTALTNARLGQYTNAGADWRINGSVAEAKISSVARTADWITTTFNNESSLSTFYSTTLPSVTNVGVFFPAYSTSIGYTTGASGSLTAAGTSVATGSFTATAGQDLWVGVALSDTTKSVSSITDTLGHTYTLKSTASNSGNVRTELWVAHNVLGGSNTITANLSGSCLAAIAVAEYSNNAQITGLNTVSGTGASTWATAPPLTLQKNFNGHVAAIGFACNSGDTIASITPAIRQNSVPAATGVGVGIGEYVVSYASSVPMYARLSASRQWAVAGAELYTNSGAKVAFDGGDGALFVGPNITQFTMLSGPSGFCFSIEEE